RTAELVAANAALRQQILEREQTEASLQRVLRDLRDFHSIVNRSPVVVCRWRVGNDWPVDFVSDNIDQFGYATADFTSGRILWVAVIHPDDLPRVLDEVDGYLQAGTREFSLEYRMFTKSGEVCWVEERDLVVTDDRGVPTHVQGIVLDVTERKEAAEKLKQLNDALEHRAAQLRALACELTETEERERHRLAQLLHDHLQQLLVAGKLRLSRLARRVSDEVLKESLHETAELIDQAITESRSLTAELSPPVLYDAGLAAGLEWLARQMQERHGLRVHLDVDAEAASAANEIAVLLFQSVRELLFNVVKHAQAESAQVRLSRRDHNQVQIIVADQGIGFDPQQLERRAVMDGFGLFSIRERLSFLGGHLAIHSTSGEGTRMVIKVPLPTQKETALAPTGETWPAGPSGRGPEPSPPDAAARTGQPIRVLLADDHPILRKGLADLLSESQGIEVVGEAGDGEEAVQLAQQTHPDIVLMDVTMPNVDGIQATRRITAELPEVRVIGLSMHEKTDLAHAMQQAGASLYLSKSAPGDELIAAIRDQAQGRVLCPQTS
ncbi:MAG: response regulator, partial [Thermoguttaceae bacterium]